ncbi:hypothetical protein [Acinetobacter gandensis]|uniref:hypothetical protein n=1 Tax=Acinetobacter gandensis TaxID=1443941 RepID=UPI003F54FA16
MKKLLVLATATTISISAFATTQFASSELKAMDCATLAVEKANSKRAIEAADKNIAGGVSKSMLTLNEAIIDVKKG